MHAGIRFDFHAVIGIRFKGGEKAVFRVRGETLNSIHVTFAGRHPCRAGASRLVDRGHRARARRQHTWLPVLRERGPIDACAGMDAAATAHRPVCLAYEQNGLRAVLELVVTPIQRGEA